MLEDGFRCVLQANIDGQFQVVARHRVTRLTNILAHHLSSDVNFMYADAVDAGEDILELKLQTGVSHFIPVGYQALFHIRRFQLRRDGPEETDDGGRKRAGRVFADGLDIDRDPRPVDRPLFDDARRPFVDIALDFHRGIGFGLHTVGSNLGDAVIGDTGYVRSCFADLTPVDGYIDQFGELAENLLNGAIIFRQLCRREDDVI